MRDTIVKLPTLAKAPNKFIRFIPSKVQTSSERRVLYDRICKSRQISLQTGKCRVDAKTLLHCLILMLPNHPKGRLKTQFRVFRRPFT
ncbi:hypothetical protein NEISICOT_02291 [Neisseria sicca ATCC 29256]|uniref:Uncharacterized protein n=1 Tax=Neisseria sicca ATCC 29256 TaxID=547045 RepID=C6M6Y7_NEISI|nr:hypothetical protein NEISICOT_02291 [Neisseria sicca ATCC 29256]